MAIGHYESVNGIARKVTKAYDSVNGVARNRVKAYDGVNGVARLFFSGEPIIETFYLRPSADVSLEHTINPSTLTAGYLAINEEVNDYHSDIRAEGKAGETAEKTSVFVMSLSGSNVPSIIRVIDAKVCGVGGKVGASGDIVESPCVVNVNGKDILIEGLDLTSSFTSLVSVSSEDVAKEINNYISANGSGELPPIKIALTSRITRNPTETKSTTTHMISQAYIELICECVG